MAAKRLMIFPILLSSLLCVTVAGNRIPNNRNGDRPEAPEEPGGPRTTNNDDNDFPPTTSAPSSNTLNAIAIVVPIGVCIMLVAIGVIIAIVVVKIRRSEGYKYNRRRKRAMDNVVKYQNQGGGRLMYGRTEDQQRLLQEDEELARALEVSQYNIYGQSTEDLEIENMAKAVRDSRQLEQRSRKSRKPPTLEETRLTEEAYRSSSDEELIPATVELGQAPPTAPSAPKRTRIRTTARLHAPPRPSRRGDSFRGPAVRGNRGGRTMWPTGPCDVIE